MSLDRIGPCLCCNKPVPFSSEIAAKMEKPAHICWPCYAQVCNGSIPWPLVLMVYDMKKQVAYLSGELEIMKRNIQNLFLAQQDVEQAVLAATSTT